MEGSDLTETGQACPQQAGQQRYCENIQGRSIAAKEHRGQSPRTRGSGVLKAKQAFTILDKWG